MTATFDKTIAALVARESNDWDLADALVVEVAPSEVGRSNQQQGTFDDLAKVLETRGIEISVSTLRQYRDTAAKWVPAERIDGISFSAHRAALPAKEDKVTVLTRLQKAHGGRVRVSDVKAALKPAPSKAEERAASHKDVLDALQEALPKAKTKAFAKWLATTDLGELEKLQDLLNEAWAVFGDAKTEAVAKAAKKGAGKAAATAAKAPRPKGNPKAAAPKTPKDKVKAAAEERAGAGARKGRAGRGA